MTRLDKLGVKSLAKSQKRLKKEEKAYSPYVI
jgi:hypothetical protein